jgi:hypothetical protein
MQTTTPTQTAPATDDPQQRSRELLLQELVGVEMLLDGGKRRAAAAALRSLLNRSSDELAREIVERAAVEELARELAWVEPQRPDVRFVPAGRVAVRRGERRAPDAADQQRREGGALAAAYLAEQPPAPVDPQTGWDEPVWGSLDYDLAALTPLCGRPCLGCKLERTRADLANPDGLCVDCRDAGLTRQTAIQRNCQLVATNNTGARATELLRATWSKAGRTADKAVIAAWVAAHQDLLTPVATS